MSNQFTPANAVITSAQFRMIGKNNDRKGKVVLNLTNGEVIFAAPKVINNIVGYKLNPSTVQMVAGSTVYYDKSTVVEGSKYKWTANDEEERIATNNLEIKNITGILLPTDKAEFIMGHCEAIASQDDWDSATADKVEEAPKGAEEE